MDAKYSTSYQLQEPKLLKFKGTNKLLYRLDIKDDKFNIGKTFHNNKETKVVYQERANLRNAILEAKTKTSTEQGLVMVMTPLNTMSIAL